MQAIRAWAPPTGTLGAIVGEAHARARLLANREPELRRAAAAAPPVAAFAPALRRDTVAVVAEVKRRSPSKGWINPGVSAADHALAYQKGGASAVSILTEPIHFGGSNVDLESVRRALRLPVLKKDFHVTPVQLLEAKALGASAALVIVRAVSPDTLAELLDVGREIRLELLVEVRDEEELARARACGATIIGVNNRNLETLEIDPMTSERVLGRISSDTIAVAESGVSGRADVERLAAWGADAVLVGSAISGAANPVDAVRTLAGVPRMRRDA